jgi:hypothetical protein
VIAGIRLAFTFHLNVPVEAMIAACRQNILPSPLGMRALIRTGVRPTKSIRRDGVPALSPWYRLLEARVTGVPQAIKSWPAVLAVTDYHR